MLTIENGFLISTFEWSFFDFSDSSLKVLWLAPYTYLSRFLCIPHSNFAPMKLVLFPTIICSKYKSGNIVKWNFKHEIQLIIVFLIKFNNLSILSTSIYSPPVFYSMCKVLPYPPPPTGRIIISLISTNYLNIFGFFLLQFLNTYIKYN